MECPEENVLVDFLRGELDRASRDDVEAHLDGCELCSEVVVELARFEPDEAELAVTDQSIAPEPAAVAEPTPNPSRERYKVAPRLAEGDKVGRYVVLHKVGAGGMGVVYAAYDPELDRKVAIKLLMTSLGGSLDAELAEQRTRLLREAQAMAKLTHPNVITVHDVGEFGDQVFVAMEFIDGGTLKDWLETHHAWRDRLEIFIAAGRGLAAAHKAGLVHRDFKPDNVLIDGEGRAVVTDFGLARPAAGKTDSFASVKVIESSPVITAQLTRTGALVGTPAYMAPEQLAGERSDAMADQFSFCVTLYEGLYGHRPFQGNVLGELMANVTMGRILPTPRDSDVPRGVLRVVLRGLSVDPSERFPTMEALIDELSPDGGRRWRRWATVLLPTSVLAVGVVAYQQTETPNNKFCDDLGAHLRGIWDAERRTAVEDAFLATGAGYAQSTWEGTADALDAYVAEWTAAQRQACEQSASGEVAPSMLALQMHCLESRRRYLGTLVGVLEQVDRNGLERARDVVDTLGSPELCSDIQALAHRESALDTPGKLANRRELDDLNNRAFVLLRTGKVSASVDVAEHALERARASGDSWSEAEALMTLGENRELQGRLDEAEDLHHRAMSAALSSANDRVILRVAVARVWAGMDPSRDVRDSERWYQHGQGALARVDSAPRLRNQLENGMAMAYMNHDEFERAEDHIQRALELHRDPERGSDVGLDSTWGVHGQLLGQMGRLEESEHALRRALELTVERYGPVHPFTIGEIENLGVTLGRQNEFEEAHELFSRALETRRIALGDDHPENANTLRNLSNIDQALGREAEGADKLYRALEIVRRSQPGSNAEASLLRRLGSFQTYFDDLDAATESLRAALALVEDMDSMPPVIRVEYDNDLGLALLRAGQLEEARAILGHARELTEDAGDHPNAAQTLLYWAAAFDDGVPDESRADVESAARALASDSNPRAAAESLLLWARVDWAAGSHDEARAHAHAARERLASAPNVEDRDLARIDVWLEEHPG